MPKATITFILYSFFHLYSCIAQDKTDSLYKLPAAEVKAYINKQPFLQLTTSAGTIDHQLLRQQMGTTLLPAFNNIPGIRMEERSPGSYRLSIRGSLLRSPFGVRNVKIYYDDIPLTDAGGNTYLNLLDANAIGEATILKGPDGSIFGANTGGVALLQSGTEAGENIQFDAKAGSYGLFQQYLSLRSNKHRGYQMHFKQAYQRSDGYRENSNMQRFFLQNAHQWEYKENHHLRLSAFYSDMDYRTPGGLTLQQYEENPSMARPATAVMPGSSEQKAGIYNKTIWSGLVHEFPVTSNLTHFASIFGSYTDFKNPFITNFEKRFETNYGFRTYLAYRHHRSDDLNWNSFGGVEWQNGRHTILNYDNEGGIQAAEQAGDAIKNNTYFYFLSSQLTWRQRLNVEGAVSLNYYGYAYRGLFPFAEEDYSTVRFTPNWMPRLAASLLVTPYFSWRASISKGYSPATTAEVRSSDNIINTALRPEIGWNYETGWRWLHPRGTFQSDVSVYYYKMTDAIVRRLRESGAEYFVNAGGTKQWGMEAALKSVLLRRPNAKSLQLLQINNNVTASFFHFSDYISGDNDFSGNRLTGVPVTALVNNMNAQFGKGISLFVQHEYASNIPLNDASNIYAAPYNLLQAKLSWQKAWTKKMSITLYTGVDNILDQTYSLGNDINAFGQRYFNAAMPRNYYIGLRLN
ncbi:TonB-dependent receptor [Olivibacter sitiensis]|uniref:TonB-dependent receptor n=1 Tax=Olivibacter sitiensis TaxID=376470 RepID=UPI0003FB435B|nr:TonB-dependent receptor [Olivibacter sitiensis]